VTITCSEPVSQDAEARHAGSDWDGLLRKIAADISVQDDAFTVAGVRRVPPDAAGVDPALRLSAALTGELYIRYYHHHGLIGYEPTAPDRRPVYAREDAEFGRRLRRAIGRRYHWERGWTIAPEHAAESLLVERDGLVLQVSKDEMRVGETGVEIRFPAERPYLSPGFFAVIGIAGPTDPSVPLARCYLNLRSQDAPGTFAAIVNRLDTFGLRFSAKVLNDPEAFTRPDSAVFYVERTDVDRLVPVALSFHDAQRFLDAVPAFTRMIAPGIALADEPPQQGQSISFGQHRSGVIARGLVEAGTGATQHQRLNAIYRAIESEGLSRERLHLNPGVREFPLSGAVVSP
jgi:hypothetical protein